MTHGCHRGTRTGIRFPHRIGNTFGAQTKSGVWNNSGRRLILKTSRDAKTDHLREFGAAQVINYRSTPNWGETIFGIADKVVNAAGGDAMTQSTWQSRLR